MPLIAFLILCLAVVGCNKKVVRSVDVPVEEALTEDVLANAELVCPGSLHLPTGAGMLAEELQVISFYGEATPNAAGKFNISMADSKKPQFVFATDPAADNTLLLGYMDPSQGEYVNLSCESTAVGLAFLSPLMMGTTAEQRNEFISGIKAHPNFPLLVEAVEATFQADPQNTLDGTIHPELYQQAAEISVDVWQEMAGAGKMLAPEAELGGVCSEDKKANVWITDGSNNEIVFCNPKMVFYVASLTLSDSNNSTDTFVHIRPKRSAYTLKISWNWGTDPEPTPHGLQDGEFEYYITKGYNWRSVPDFGEWDWDQPYGRATYLNIAQFFVHIIDIFAGFTLQIPEVVPAPEFVFDNALGTAIREGNKRETSVFDFAIGIASGVAFFWRKSYSLAD